MKKQRSLARRALGVAAASGVVLGVLVPSAAYATDYPDVAGEQAQSSSGTLPFTGPAEVVQLATIGAGALLSGGVLVRSSRRRRDTD